MYDIVWYFQLHPVHDAWGVSAKDAWVTGWSTTSHARTSQKLSLQTYKPREIQNPQKKIGC